MRNSWPLWWICLLYISLNSEFYFYYVELSKAAVRPWVCRALSRWHSLFPYCCWARHSLPTPCCHMHLPYQQRVLLIRKASCSFSKDASTTVLPPSCLLVFWWRLCHCGLEPLVYSWEDHNPLGGEFLFLWTTCWLKGQTRLRERKKTQGTLLSRLSAKQQRLSLLIRGLFSFPELILRSIMPILSAPRCWRSWIWPANLPVQYRPKRV